MKKNIPIILSVVVFSLLLSCDGNNTKNTSGQTNGDSTGIVVDPVFDQKAAQFADVLNCNSLLDYGYCNRGFNFVSLGDDYSKELVVAGNPVIKEIEMKDDFSGDTWKARELTFAGGKIILEPDFGMQGLITRIRIEATEFKNMHGIGVGSTVASLKDAYKSLRVSAYEGMNIAEISIGGNPFVFFHVEDAGNASIKPGDANANVNMLPETAKIVRVIIWDTSIGTQL